MSKRTILVCIFAVLIPVITACSRNDNSLSEDGARKIVIGVGNGTADSTPYQDHDKPTPTPTPSPEVTATPVVTMTPVPTGPVITGTPKGDGAFDESDCAVVVAGIRLFPGMDFTGKEEAVGKVIDKLEGVSCLQAGYDINYYYKGFHVDTIRQNDRQYIYLADFTGGDALTEAGIGIGSSEEDLIAAYGTPYEDSLTQRVYKSGKMQMTFYISDEKVTEFTIVDTSLQ